MTSHSFSKLKLDLITWIAQVEDIEVLENISKIKKEGENSKTVLSSKQKIVPTVEDLQAIADTFPTDKKWTYADLEEHFPKDLKIKVEILNNKLIIMASLSFIHQKISSDLSFEMKSFVKKHDLGELLVAPMDTKFDEDNLLQPDILFISVRRYENIKANYIEGAPDLVVEIISPSNTQKEQAEKRDLYERKGVEEYWTIFPKKRSIKVEILENEIYQLFSEGTKEGIIQSSVLEGFEIKIEDLMPDTLFQEK